MRVDDHFPKSAMEFEEILEEAEDQYSGEWAEDFVKDMRKKYDQYGGSMFLSDKQLAALKKIAYGE